jgi:hypothetical protein
MQKRQYGIASLIGDGDIKTRHLEDGAITLPKLDASLDLGEQAGTKKTITVGETITARNALRAARGTSSLQSLTTGGGFDEELQGTGGSAEMLAVRYQPASAVAVSSFTARLKRVGSPVDNLVATVEADSSGSPSGTPLGTSTAVVMSTIGTTYQDVTFTFSTPVTLTAGTYYIKLARTGSMSSSARVDWHADIDGSPTSPISKYRVSGTWYTRTPGYLHTITDSDGTAGQYLKANAASTANAKVIGFATEGGAAAAEITMQNTGILGGFSGLTVGSIYYLKDDGTIGTTAGTVSLIVGRAISETELAIDIQES